MNAKSLLLAALAAPLCGLAQDGAPPEASAMDTTPPPAAVYFTHDISPAGLEKACGVGDLKMSDWGIRREELPGMPALARSAVGALFSVDPSPLTDDDVLAILEASWR